MKNIIYLLFTSFALIGCGGGDSSSTNSNPTSAGADGANGLSTLVNTTSFNAGEDANCAYGGIKIDAGLDDNNNGTLEHSEIDNTAYSCNGADGLPGANGTDGVDGLSGTDGANGADGLNTLINTTSFNAGEDANCAYGGIKIDVGLDDDSNGTLESSEIDNTVYSCNGADGLPGTDGADGANGLPGADGANGLSTLINTTSFNAGEDANCAYGGIKIDVGLDDDSNGTLENSEIDSTAYVCNGADGTNGTPSIPVLDGLGFNTPPAIPNY